MPILSTELKWFRSAAVNDTSTNGGRISNTELVGTISPWPVIAPSERASGITKVRKLFQRIASATNTPADVYRLMLFGPSSKEDRFEMLLGTLNDTEASLPTIAVTAGTLNTSVLAGATSLTVVNETGTAATRWRNGMLVYLSNEVSVGDGGVNEFVRVAAASGVSISGNNVTLNLASALVNAYPSGAKVCGVIEAANVIGTFSGQSVVSAAGTVALSGAAPLVIPSIGSMSAVWTLAFTSATAFNLTGDTLGAIGSGSRSADFSPVNPSTGTPYFTLPAAAWGGTWANGDTLSFRTDPPVVPVWFRVVVPAGASAYGNSDTQLITYIESV